MPPLLAPHPTAPPVRSKLREPAERRPRRRAGRGDVGDQPLVSVLDVHDLALELQRPGQRVIDALDHRVPRRHLVLGPHRREPRGQREQLANQRTDRAVARIPGIRRAQVRHGRPGERHRVLIGPIAVAGGPPEHPADHVPVVLGEPRQVADEVAGQLVPGQDVILGADHVGGSLRHGVDQVPDPRRNVAARARQRGRFLAADAEQVLPLVGGQHQRAGQRGEHLPRRAGAACLLEPYVVIDGKAGQLRDLLAAQPGRTTALAAGQADIARLQPVPAAAQEHRELVAVEHGSSMPLVPGPAVRRGWYRQSQDQPVSPRLPARRRC